MMGTERLIDYENKYTLLHQNFAVSDMVELKKNCEMKMPRKIVFANAALVV